MARYLVVHRYSAVRDGQQLGPWQPGDEVELTEADAAWVCRDSAGVLTLAGMDPRSTPPAESRRKATR